MKLNRRTLMGLFAAASVAALTTPSQAQDPEFTFTIHHFLSPMSPSQQELIEPWVQRVEEQSNGRIKFEIFPSMSLGGAPPELYSQVRDGVVDIVWTLPGYTPGVFPRIEVFELPTVHVGSAEVTTQAIQDIMPMLEEDFQDVHPLLVHVHTGQALHTVDKDVNTVEDLQGMKIRSPSRTGAWVLESWGAEAVGMPVPELPQALSRGLLDGTLIPYEITIPLRTYELVDYSIEMHDGRRFGTSSFLFAMNKDAYESLPDDLKKVIDDNSGANIAKEIGAAWDAIEPKGKELAREAGVTVKQLPPEFTENIMPLHEQVEARWIEEAKSQGIDADALVAAAKDAIAKYSQ